VLIRGAWARRKADAAIGGVKETQKEEVRLVLPAQHDAVVSGRERRLREGVPGAISGVGCARKEQRSLDPLARLGAETHDLVAQRVVWLDICTHARLRRLT